MVFQGNTFLALLDVVISVDPGTGNIFMDDVNCNGNEHKLIDCPAATPLGTHNCRHSQDAGVKCSRKWILRALQRA